MDTHPADKFLPEWMVKAIDRIRALTEIDLQNKPVSELFQSVGEEMGELARELNIEDGVFGNKHKEGGTDGSMGESVDLTICALAMYFARGGDVFMLPSRIQNKLDKWECKQKESLAEPKPRTARIAYHEEEGNAYFLFGATLYSCPMNADGTPSLEEMGAEYPRELFPQEEIDRITAILEK